MATLAANETVAVASMCVVGANCTSNVHVSPAGTVAPEQLSPAIANCPALVPESDTPPAPKIRSSSPWLVTVTVCAVVVPAGCAPNATPVGGSKPTGPTVAWALWAARASPERTATSATRRRGGFILLLAGDRPAALGGT